MVERAVKNGTRKLAARFLGPTTHAASFEYVRRNKTKGGGREHENRKG
jgi:hypothetical protein